MMRIWSSGPWLQPLSRNCNSRSFEGCLALAIVKRWKTGSEITVKWGSRKEERVLRKKVLGEVLMIE